MNPFVFHTCLVAFTFGFFVGMAIRLFVTNLYDQ
jgi:hypothetical protein